MLVSMAIGASGVYGYKCNSSYTAIHALAYGDLDVETGQHTSIFTQYIFRANVPSVTSEQTLTHDTLLTNNPTRSAARQRGKS
jgi:hypothetical protein